MAENIFPDVNQYADILSQNAMNNNAFNAAQAEKQMQFQEASNAKAMEFSHREAELNRQWQTLMSNTAYQRQLMDMIAAGLNPVLGVSNSGASVGSVGNPTGIASAGAKGEADTSLNGAFANFVSALVNSETAKVTAKTAADASMRNALVTAESHRYAADQSASATRYAAGASAAAMRYSADQSASAMRYAADASKEASMYGTDENISWNKEYNEKYNMIGIYEDFIDWLNGTKKDPNGILGKTFDTAFDHIFGKDGITIVTKQGRTIKNADLWQTRMFWNDLSDVSKATIKTALYGYDKQHNVNGSRR